MHPNIFQMKCRPKMALSSLTTPPMYLYTNETDFTSTVEWDNNTPPQVGLSLILSTRQAQRYQTWNKERQLFKSLIGPFSIVDPSNGRAVTMTSGACKTGMGLASQADDYTSERQQFYLGQHGSIFSKSCLGLVISASKDGTVKLETFRLSEKHQKWKFASGTVENVAFQGKFIASDEANGMAIVLQSNATVSSQKWKRINTRLLNLDEVNQTEWQQEWTVTFVSSVSPNVNLEELARHSNGLGTTCYKQNPAFSTAFDDFATGLVISDATDEEQCGEARDGLGFDRDHSFDTQVREISTS